MEAQAQVMLMLVQQNAKLLQELEALKSELAKYKSAAPVDTPIAPEKPKKESTKKKINVSPEGHAAHVASGKRLAAYNAAKKAQLEDFKAAAQLEGEWSACTKNKKKRP